MQTVEQAEVYIGARDFKNESRETCPRSDVDNRGTLGQCDVAEEKQAIVKMFYNDFFGVGYCREVHFFVPFNEQLSVGFEALAGDVVERAEIFREVF